MTVQARPGSRTIQILIAFALLFITAPHARAIDDFGVTAFSLKNGLQVVVIEDHRAPIATHMVWYRVGAVDEFRGKSGLAHYLEHLMFKGSKKIPAGEFSKIIARNGGRDNAFTSFDQTAYFQRIAVDRLPLVMEMEADRMTNLTIDEDEAVKELQVVIEERRLRVENSPSALFGEQMRLAQYLSYPYRVPIIGWMQDLQQLTREDALAFYRTYYAPNNAILVVAGDVTVDQIRSMAEAHYGAIPRGEIPERILPPEPPHRTARRIEMKDRKVQKATWSRTYFAPSYGYGQSELVVPLQVFTETFGGGTTSRLYQELVVKRKVAVGVAAWYQPRRQGPTTLGISVTPRDDDVARVEAAVDEVIAQILSGGLDEAAVARSKTALAANATYARDNHESLANLFGTALIIGMDIADLETWSDQVRLVTPEQALAAAQYVLVPEKSVTGILLPDRKAAPTAPEEEK